MKQLNEVARMQQIAGIPLNENKSERGYSTLQDVMDAHGVDQEFIDNYILNIDELTPEEMEDLDYIEDRIMAHLSNEDGYDDLGNKLNEEDEMEDIGIFDDIQDDLFDMDREDGIGYLENIIKYCQKQLLYYQDDSNFE